MTTGGHMLQEKNVEQFSVPKIYIFIYVWSAGFGRYCSDYLAINLRLHVLFIKFWTSVK